MSQVVPFNTRVELLTPMSDDLDRRVSTALRPFAPAVGVTEMGWVDIYLTVQASDLCGACTAAIDCVRDVVQAPVLSVEARIIHESDAA